MKVVVAGAGAMGSLFAWQFADAGAEVWVYDIWKDHVDAINAHGLKVRHNEQELTTNIKATTNPEVIGTCDVVLIFVKYHQTLETVKTIKSAVRSDTILVTFQNGIGNVDHIKSVFPNNRILYGLTTLTSELIGAGRIEASYKGQGESYLWPVDGIPVARDREICQLLSGSQGVVDIDPNIDLRIWKKLVINACFNSVCSILNCTVGESMCSKNAQLLFDGLIDEITNAAQAKHINLTKYDAIQYLKRVGKSAATHVPSMVMDIRAGRKTEIECLNGAILAVCEQYNLNCDVNRTIVNLVNSIEDIRTLKTSVG